MSGSGVAVEAVSFGYGQARILDDVSLQVNKGEFFAFLGPSGSGKTTLLRLIAGFGTPGSGRILIGGRDVSRVPPWRRNVGMVFQNYALWPHMSVGANVAFGLEQRRRPRAEIQARVAAALDLVGLADYADRRPAQLSGGQQQRVALARTLVIEPDVLLLDEPLSNLDAQLRVEMRAELVALQRKIGLTTIYVTHDQEEANAIADRMAVLDQGRIRQLGRPIELYDRPADAFVAGFLGTANLIPAEGGGRWVLRPQDITLVEAGRGRLRGRVVQAEFLGASVRHRIAVGDAVLIVDEPHRLGRAAPQAGAEVGLDFDPDRSTRIAD
ncbi:MAG: ABC transporter ATP-binding protein [Alphaproteobacteria bacterium]|nr:ABC transporter ATP-binding protein [Alphaproteobacteria bacterium]